MLDKSKIVQQKNGCWRWEGEHFLTRSQGEGDPQVEGESSPAWYSEDEQKWKSVRRTLVEEYLPEKLATGVLTGKQHPECPTKPGYRCCNPEHVVFRGKGKQAKRRAAGKQRKTKLRAEADAKVEEYRTKLYAEIGINP